MKMIFAFASKAENLGEAPTLLLFLDLVFQAVQSQDFLPMLQQLLLAHPCGPAYFQIEKTLIKVSFLSVRDLLPISAAGIVPPYSLGKFSFAIFSTKYLSVW